MRVRFSPQALLTFFFLVVFSAAIACGWEWPYIAKLMPVYIAAIPGAFLTVVQLYRDVTGWEKRAASGHGIDMDEAFIKRLDQKTEIMRTLAFFGWYVGGALAIWLLGIVIALPLLVLLYALVEGREKWGFSVLMAAVTFGFIWGLFDYMMEMRWPAGLLFR